MKTSSAKAKGRRLQQFVAKRIASLLGITYGVDELIRSREMGQKGCDVVLIGEAKQRFPFDIEVKNCEKWSIVPWIEQTKDNTEKGRNWLLICAKNRHLPVAILDFETFIEILEGKIKI